jgi:3-dehydroshikimate dehydratase
VAFRHLSIEAVVRLAAAAQLDGIEWGGDVHVPSGDLRAARRAADACATAGLDAASYGSYLCAGRDDSFDAALETAVALGARNVRVWAGDRGSASADDPFRDEVAAALRRWCSAASDMGLTVSLEHHAGTLTDTAASSLRLLASVPAPNLRTYWQPRDGHAGTRDLDELAAVRPHLAHVHVFWWHDGATRFPLSEGMAFWQPALSGAASAPETPRGGRYAFIEFVKGDDPEQLLADAAALRSWLL